MLGVTLGNSLDIQTSNLGTDRKDDLCAAICPEGAIEVDDEAHNKVVGIKDTSYPFITLLKEAED